MSLSPGCSVECQHTFILLIYGQRAGALANLNFWLHLWIHLHGHRGQRSVELDAALQHRDLAVRIVRTHPGHLGEAKAVVEPR